MPKVSRKVAASLTSLLLMSGFTPILAQEGDDHTYRITGQVVERDGSHLLVNGARKLNLVVNQESDVQEELKAGDKATCEFKVKTPTELVLMRAERQEDEKGPDDELPTIAQQPSGEQTPTLPPGRQSEPVTPPAPPAGEQAPAPAPAPAPPAPSGEQTPTPPEPLPGGEQNQPRIVNIEVEGNANVPTDEILQVVSTRIGDPILEPRIRRDAQAIFDLGYFTDVRLDTRLAPGGVRLVFRVLENPVVNTVTVSGNQLVPNEKILSLMDTKTGKILNTRTLHSDLQNINKYYDEELGYLLPNHVEDLTFDKGALNIKLREGLRLTKVEVEGMTVFQKEQIEKLVRLKPGDLFNKKTVIEDSAAISRLYENNDYILDTIVPKVDNEKGVLTMRVQESVLQEIRVEGNVRTTTDTVIRNMRSKPGQVMQKRRIQKDLERLNNLGFFKKVEINPEPGTEPGKYILVLDVEEQKTGLATIGLGYAGGGTGAIRPGITGAVSLSDRNLFGEGQSASIQLQAGSQIRTAAISLLDPAINDNQDSLGGSIFYNEVLGLRQPITVNGVTDFAFYQDRRYGGTLTYGHPFTDDFRGFVTARRETIEITRDPISILNPIGLGSGGLNALGISAVYDTRDDVFNPHIGSFLNGSITHAGLGGTFNFNKYTVEARHYVPLGDRHTIALRGWYGVLSGGPAPLSEFFFAGGVDTMRGYLQNQFFGTNFMVLNAEYRFPIGNIKFLNGAVFADAGNAWTPGVTPGRLYADAGIGLRIVFPTLGLGVIRVDYAFGELGGRTSIGIGQSF